MAGALYAVNRELQKKMPGCAGFVPGFVRGLENQKYSRDVGAGLYRLLFKAGHHALFFNKLVPLSEIHYYALDLS